MVLEYINDNLDLKVLKISYKLQEGQAPWLLLIFVHLGPHLTGSIGHLIESGCCEIQINIPFQCPASAHPSSVPCVNKPVGAQLAFSSGGSQEVQMFPLFPTHYLKYVDCDY